LSRRTETRLDHAIPVRLWGMDNEGKPFNETLTTTDISINGAKLVGLKAKLRHGDVVLMQSQIGKTRVRVTWAGDADSPSAGQISVCCVEPGKCIWDPKLFQRIEAPVVAEAIGSRRKAVRYVCPGGAELTLTRSGMSLWCKLADISYTGCYIETPTPLSPGTEVLVKLTVDGETIESLGEVRTSHMTVGMGVAFGEMGVEESQKLGQLIKKLSGTDERRTESLEKYSMWLEGVRDCDDAIEALRSMVERGEVDPVPVMSGDLERLQRMVAELRQFVVSRVSNYGPKQLAD
jgi:PilZ domain